MSKLNLVLLATVALLFSVECRRFSPLSGGPQPSAVQRITPALKPKSDDRFFGKGKDYMADAGRESVPTEFDHPYPAVQDHQDYDTDFVMDSNEDNGEWKTQLEYDELRAKVIKEKKEMEDAKAALDSAESDVTAAKKEHKAATSNAQATEREVGEKRAAAKRAAENLDASTDKVVAETGSLDEARKEVENDEMTLEECKKKLAKVQEDLARLEADETGAVQRALEAEAEVRKAKRMVAAAEKNVELTKAATAKELQDVNEAKAVLKKEKADVVQTEEELEEARKKVEHFRDREDADGGVYPEKKGWPHSAAATPLPALVAVLVVMTGKLL